MKNLRHVYIIVAAVFLTACQGLENQTFDADGNHWSSEGEVPGEYIPALSVSTTNTQVSVTVTGNMVEYVDVYLDKELSPRGNVAKAPFSFTLPFAGIAPGAHELRVVAGVSMLGQVSTLTRYVPFNVPQVSAGPACDQVGRGEFFGCFYSGLNFDKLVFTRMDKEIRFDFGAGSPDSRLAADNFSIKWQGNFDFNQAGKYTFTVKADDGIRVSVDGKRIINEWRNQAATQFSAQVDLSKGSHRVDVEYYEAYSAAEVSVGWALAGGSEPPNPGPSPQPTPLPSDGTYGARPVPRSKAPSANDTFVSPNGNGNCTQQSPCSLTTGMSQGSFIWMMSGTYNVTSQITLRNNKTLEALEPQKAIIDFGGRSARLAIDNNTVLRNVVVRRAGGLAGIQVFGNNNLIEGVISELHYYSGIAFWCGGYEYGTNPPGASFNTISDTIVRYNSENCAKEGSGTNCSDSDADGISISCGRGNRVIHSEAHYNADDGIDVWRSYQSTVENCISTGSGRDPNNPARVIGNGNGYKMGGPLGAGNDHTFVNNWSYGNARGDFSYNTGYGFNKVSGNVCGENKTPCNPR